MTTKTATSAAILLFISTNAFSHNHDKPNLDPIEQLQKRLQFCANVPLEKKCLQACDGARGTDSEAIMCDVIDDLMADGENSSGGSLDILRYTIKGLEIYQKDEQTSPNLAVGSHRRLYVEGTFMDRSKRDISKAVTWTSSDSILIVDAPLTGKDLYMTHISTMRAVRPDADAWVEAKWGNKSQRYFLEILPVNLGAECATLQVQTDIEGVITTFACPETFEFGTSGQGDGYKYYRNESINKYTSIYLMTTKRMDLTTANEYCAAQGYRLPTRTELTTLADEMTTPGYFNVTSSVYEAESTLGPTVNYGWSVDEFYWSSTPSPLDDGDFMTVGLQLGGGMKTAPSNLREVTCVID